MLFFRSKVEKKLVPFFPQLKMRCVIRGHILYNYSVCPISQRFFFCFSSYSFFKFEKKSLFAKGQISKIQTFFLVYENIEKQHISYKFLRIKTCRNLLKNHGGFFSTLAVIAYLSLKKFSAFMIANFREKISKKGGALSRFIKFYKLYL